MICWRERLRLLSPLARWLIVLGLFLLCYIWGFFYYTLQRDRDAARLAAYNDMENYAQLFQAHAERVTEYADQFTLFVKRTYERGGWDALGSLQYLQKQDAFFTICVVDENGQLRAGSWQGDFGQLSQVMAGRMAVERSIAEDSLAMGRVFWDADRQHYLLPMTRSLRHADGSFAGLVIAFADPHYFDDFYNQLHLYSQAEVVLLGRDGQIRAARPQGDLALGSRLPAASPFMHYMHDPAGTKDYVAVMPGYTGRYIYACRSLTRYPLAVAAAIPESLVLNGLQPQFRYYALLAAAMTALVLFFMLLVLRQVRRRQQAEEALQAANNTLQQKVEERTLRLVGANERLRDMNVSLENANQQLEDEITERRAAEAKLKAADEELRMLAYYDPITRMPNRLALIRWLEEAMDGGGNAAKGSLMVVDLDDLQTVNDVFGHPYGDAVIRMAAERIQQMAGDTVFAAHFGADEFCVVFPGEVRREQYAEAAEGLLQAIRHVHRFDNISVHVTASIGVALYPDHGEAAEEIMKNADNAAAVVKKNGKDHWRLFSEEMRAELYENVMLTTQLHRAVREKEFLLHYQPQVDAATGRVKGFEALIRWQSPELGFVSPARFIPLAERNGLIHAIGQWVLAEACRFATHLAEQGYGKLRVSVNVSGQQFSRDDFLDSVHQIITASGASVKQIELEITETAVLKSLDEAVEKLRCLRDYGIQVSLDDFGTGYSSLNYLLQLPFDTLKIDKSFIDMIGLEAKGGQIIEAILSLAHVLEKSVIAEGVETKEQLAYLQSIHCDTIQGYYFSRPLPETDAMRFLQQCAAGEGGIG